jgi:hypothetical protein
MRRKLGTPKLQAAKISAPTENCNACLELHLICTSYALHIQRAFVKRTRRSGALVVVLSIIEIGNTEIEK